MSETQPLHLHFRHMAPQLMDIRTRLPAEALARVPGVTVTEDTSVALRRLPPEEPKLIITQRQRAGDEMDWLSKSARMIRHGWLSILEYDDHPKLTYAVRGAPLDEAAWRYFSQFHAVQTSTPRLAELFRRWNPEVAVFPNAVFGLPPLAPPNNPPRLFYGGVARGPVAVEMMRSLEPVLTLHPEVTVVVVGDREAFEAAATSNKTYKDYLPFEDYNRLMAACDISLSPLAEMEGVDCKSDAKFLDGARNGAVTVASPVVYAETIVHGETGFIAHEQWEWGALVSMLIERQDLRARVAANAWNYVRRERMFAHQIPARLAWYRSLWDRRQDLTYDFAERAPPLRDLVLGSSA